MNNVKTNVRSILLIFLGILLMTASLGQTAFAATVSFDVSVSAESVSPGDTFQVTVGLISDSENISSYTYNILYDPELIQISSGGEIVSDGCISYTGSGNDLMTFTFTAIANGTASIQTSSKELILESGESINIPTAYNSIAISANSSVTDSEDSQDTSEDASVTTSDDSQELSSQDSDNSDDEIGILTEADVATEAELAEESETSDEANTPAGTLVSLHSQNNLYYIVDIPDTEKAPSGYTPVTITLNEVDIAAYIKGLDSNTVLLYAVNSTDSEAEATWYFFNSTEGTFLKANDIINSGTSALDNFIDQNKFVIMLVAIIVLIILVVVIIILAVSLKGLIKDYEEQIDSLKRARSRKNNSGDEAAISNDSSEADSDSEQSDESSDSDEGTNYDEDSVPNEGYLKDDASKSNEDTKPEEVSKSDNGSKTDNDAKSDGTSKTSGNNGNFKRTSNHMRFTPAGENHATIGDKALFPEDTGIHGSYADTDFDNQVPLEYSPEEGYDDDSDDYDETAYDSDK
jgi:hypothetical protein